MIYIYRQQTHKVQDGACYHFCVILCDLLGIYRSAQYTFSHNHGQLDLYKRLVLSSILLKTDLIVSTDLFASFKFSMWQKDLFNLAVMSLIEGNETNLLLRWGALAKISLTLLTDELSLNSLETLFTL